MKTRWILRLALGLTYGLSCQQAEAISLRFSPSSQTILLGSQASVDIIIDDLGNQQPPSLGAFDIDINFASNILGFPQVQFGTNLDLGLFGSSQEVINLTVNSLNITELSLENSLDLDAAQPESFKLATLTFNSLNLGNSPLSFSRVILSDAEGMFLMASTVNGAIAVTASPVTAVPETSSWISLMTFGLLLTFFRYFGKFLAVY